MYIHILNKNFHKFNVFVTNMCLRHNIVKETVRISVFWMQNLLISMAMLSRRLNDINLLTGKFISFSEDEADIIV